MGALLFDLAIGCVSYIFGSEILIHMHILDVKFSTPKAIV